MPSSTFFRLPEEKRSRLLEAARGEFTRTAYTEVSINRIIQEAHIPRGSFYQYFSDKDDLFRYLLADMQQYFTKTLCDILQETEGDLFAMPLRCFDRFFEVSGLPDATLAQIVRIIQHNRGMDVQQMVFQHPPCIPPDILTRIDTSQFRRTDDLFLQQTFFLVVASLAFAFAETLRQPEQRARQREDLEARMEIIRAGSISPDHDGAAAVSHKEES